MKKLLAILLACLFVYQADAQVFIRSNASFGTSQFRIDLDSTLYYPTGCGVPTGVAYLFSKGFGAGEIKKKSALYYDSCGHHLYTWDPKLQSWTQVGSGTGGGGGSDTGINQSVGTGYRLIIPGSRFVKSVKTSKYLTIDTLSDPNVVKFVLDTTFLPSGTSTDTFFIVPKGNGLRNIYGDGTHNIYDKTDVPGYGIFIANQSDSSKKFTADTTSANGLVSKARLSATLFPVQSNLGTGFRAYSSSPAGYKTFFTKYALTWDSVSNTNGLTLSIDTFKIATKLWVMAQIATYGGGGGGGGGGAPDTVTLVPKGTAIPMVQANGTASLFVRTVLQGYGVFLDTLLTGAPLQITLDTASTHGAVSKDRFTATLAAIPGLTFPPNIGAANRVYSPQVPGFRSLHPLYGIGIDSTSFSGELSFKADTTSAGGLASKTYITNVFNDTTKSSLQKVMDNSSFLSTSHNINGAPQTVNSYPPWTFTWGIGLGNRSGAFPTETNLVYIYGDSLWKNNAAGSPRNLERVGGGLDPVINVYDSTDSAHTVYVFNSGRRYVTAYSGGSSVGGGSGGTTTLQQAITAQGTTPVSGVIPVDNAGLEFTSTNQTGAPAFFGGAFINGIFLNYHPSTTSNYTPVYTDDFIPVNATSGSITISVSNSIGTGKVLFIRKTDNSGNAVNITTTTGGAEIGIGSGTNTYSLSTKGKWVAIMSGGTGSWEIMMNN